MFDFRLKVFHTVARRLNFTKAAEELFITQPAVTKHIHEIENYYKVKLFDRHGTRIKLTKAGEILLQHTEQLFTVYRNMEFELNMLQQRYKGILTIGASTTLAQYVLPPVLAAFHKKFDDIQIALTTNNTGEIESALQQSHIDLGVIEGMPKNSVFKYTEFVKDELVLVARYGHPLAKKGIIKPEDLLKIPLLLREPGSGTLEVIAHALSTMGIKINQLQREMQLASTEGMKLYLLNTDCMAFLPIYSILKELQNKECCIIDVKGLHIERFFYFIQPQGQADGPPDLFMKFARHYNFR